MEKYFIKNKFYGKIYFIKINFMEKQPVKTLKKGCFLENFISEKRTKNH